MTTGRFDTREELETWVWHNWQNTPACQADIARQCRVSPTTVANILKSGISQKVRQRQGSQRPHQGTGCPD